MILTVTMSPSIDKLYLVDKNELGTVMRVRRVSNTAGGKGLNVSRIVDQLGERVTAMGLVGGYTGEYFKSLIKGGIQQAFTQIAADTRSCINVWEEGTRISTEYLEPGAPVTQEEAERFFADFARQLEVADVVTISGSLPKGAPTDSYESLIGMCRKRGKKVLLDTSGDSLRRGAEAHPDLLKPNREELGQLLGRPPQDLEDTLRSAQELHRQGIAWVAVSLGAEGAILVSDEGAFHGKPPKINPQNTVGCGDSMVGGFAVALSRGMDSRDALKLAVAVSAANALTLSTGSYCEEDFLRMMDLTQITEI